MDGTARKRNKNNAHTTVVCEAGSRTSVPQ